MKQVSFFEDIFLRVPVERIQHRAGRQAGSARGSPCPTADAGQSKTKQAKAAAEHWSCSKVLSSSLNLNKRAVPEGSTYYVAKL